MTTLVYPGVGWDNKFLKYLDKYDRYILIDALPDTPHYYKGQAGYPKCHNKKTFFKTLQKKFGAIINHNKTKHILYFRNNVEYYYNCDANTFDLSNIENYEILIRGYMPKTWDEYYKGRRVMLDCTTYIGDDYELFEDVHFHSDDIDCDDVVS